jgi:hypothetical protein
VLREFCKVYGLSMTFRQLILNSSNEVATVWLGSSYEGTKVNKRTCLKVKDCIPTATWNARQLLDTVLVAHSKVCLRPRARTNGTTVDSLFLDPNNRRRANLACSFSLFKCSLSIWSLAVLHEVRLLLLPIL